MKSCSSFLHLISGQQNGKNLLGLRQMLAVAAPRVYVSESSGLQR